MTKVEPPPRGRERGGSAGRAEDSGDDVRVGEHGDQALLFHELVAHGKGSGDDVATRFGNEAGSNQSSLGVFLTAETYSGKHGYSLRLNGLESEINDRARDRAIVIHAADYVSSDFAERVGRLGRSHGKALIDRIAGGSVVVAYGDDETWLATSAYVPRAD